MKKRHQITKSNKILTIIGIIVISIFCFETVGFATYNQLLRLNGTSTFNPDGNISITDIQIVNQTNVVENAPVSYSDLNITFDLEFPVTTLDLDYEIRYSVTIDNESSYDRTFTGEECVPQINIQDGTSVELLLEGLEIGDVINKKSSKTFDLIIALHPQTENTTYDVNGTIEEEEIIEDTGQILVSLDRNNRSADLTAIGAKGHFTFDAVNTLQYTETVTLSVSSNIFELCDVNGNALPSFTVNNDGNTVTNDFYVKVKSGAVITRNSEYLTVYATTSKFNNQSIGRLTLAVTPNAVYHDSDAPIIRNVTATQNSIVNSAHVSWNASDDSTIDNFTVIAYKADGTKVNELTTTDDSNSVDILISDNQNNVDGNYYFVVYGKDINGNTANSNEISDPQTQGHAAKSANVNLDWYVAIRYTNLTGDKTEALRGGTVTITIQSTNNTTPTLTSVKMNGTTLNNNANGYSTSTTDNSRTITINRTINGDIEINASNGNGGGCLVEGTLIKTKNGYKKIEDITYYDLLEVWSHDTGSITYEYPIWIDLVREKSEYRLIKFDDGSELKTVDYHGIYSYDLNRFVSVDNPQEFHVGTTVAKVKNGKLYKAKVTSIEMVKERVKYYFVGSTKYFNIIANDFLTTDGNVIISNIFEFDKNLKWKNRDNVLKYTYEEFDNLIPYYMYVGTRAYEAKNLPISLNEFKAYLGYTFSDKLDQVKPLPTFNGKNKFIVSTSTGKTSFVLEGDTYTLPRGKWLSNTDYKIYEGTVKIDCSTYFIKVK